jgi:multiple sugar transport system permease protein
MGFITQRGVLWGEMSAASTVIMMPMILFTFLVQRYLIRGLTFGAVKG